MNKENMIKFSDFFFFLFFHFLLLSILFYLSLFWWNHRWEKQHFLPFSIHISVGEDSGERFWHGNWNIAKWWWRGKNILKERGKNILEERRIFSWKRIFVQKMQKMNFPPLQNLVWFPWNKLWSELVTFSDRKRREDCKKEEEEMRKGEKKMKPHFSVAEKRVILAHYIFCASSRRKWRREKRREKEEKERRKKKNSFFVSRTHSFQEPNNNTSTNCQINKRTIPPGYVLSIFIHSFSLSDISILVPFFLGRRRKKEWRKRERERLKKKVHVN